LENSMAFQWMRRVLLALAPAVLLALAACGSGSIESQFTPTRVVAFGDGLSDIGNTGKKFTVNDTSPVWPAIVALDFGATLDKSASGGTDYATGNARIVLTPDAVGNGAPTIKAQVDTFLATHGSFNDGDLVILQGGISDIIVQTMAYRAGTITSDQMVQNVKQAAHDMADQARRIVAAGAAHVAIVGVYDLGKTPWAAAINQKTLLSDASLAFDNTLLIELVDEGHKMLYIDVPLLVNLMVSSPSSYALTNVTDPVCTSVDPGPGIGIGTGQVSSTLCTTTTIVSGADYNGYLWADPVYPTPITQSRIADVVYSRVHNRW
jgi:outer membrane lipase/esterase